VISARDGGPPWSTLPLGIADVEDLERALVRIFRDPMQRRIPEHVAPDVWFEVGR
jgi:hypothetical protein